MYDSTRAMSSNSATLACSSGDHHSEPARSVDVQLAELKRCYDVTQQPVQVDFRKLVPWIRYGERFTHFIHPYPAKLLPHIPHFFLSSTTLSQPGARILDPFCGSGTVLLESLLTGREPCGADSNPLARLLSRVKTRPLDAREIAAGSRAIKRFLSSSRRAPIPPKVVNMGLWFPPQTTKALAKIREGIARIDNIELREFFLLSFSWCTNRVSLADPRIAVPVRLRRNQYPEGHWLRARTNKILRERQKADVAAVFFETVEANTKRMSALSDALQHNIRPVTIFEDARTLTPTVVGSVDAIISSPPYAGAQKYIRSSSLSLGWLGFGGPETLREYEKMSIGREHYATRDHSSRFLETGIEGADRILSEIHKANSLRAHIAGQYLREMDAALNAATSVLKPGGFMVLVAGANTICGRAFDTPGYLLELLQRSGMEAYLQVRNKIHSRGLMTTRNTTAAVIVDETVLVLRKTLSAAGARSEHGKLRR